MPEGIVLKGIGGFYYVETDDGIYCCRAKGIFRKYDVKPLPGDAVEIDIIDEKIKEGSLTVIKDRRNELKRPEVANIDQVIIMVSVKAPGPDLFLLDKLLVSAEILDITPIVCINKIDLDEDNLEGEIINDYKYAGFKLFNISAKNKIGIDRIKQILKGKITVLSGQSGVGKSTLLNAVMQENLMETGIVSAKNERGKHTTRHAELIKLLSGGYIIDTPGFSNYELDEIEHMELKEYYPEFYEHEGNCRFNTCVHLKEPGCAVKEALESGNIGQGRYKRYRILYENIRNIKKY